MPSTARTGESRLHTFLFLLVAATVTLVARLLIAPRVTGMGSVRPGTPATKTPR